MLDLQEIQILGQLVDNLEVAYGRLEKVSNNKDSQEFITAKNEVLKIQNKIGELLK